MNLRKMNEETKEKTINKSINMILHLKTKTNFYNENEKKWCSASLLLGIINDVNPYLSDYESKIIAIEISKKLAKEYDIFGYD